MSASESSFGEDENIIDLTGELPETGDFSELTKQLSSINIIDARTEEPEVQVLTVPWGLPGEADEFIAHQELNKLLLDLYERHSSCAVVPNAVANLIELKKLNTMVLDLYDYDKGYEISFRKFADDTEICHGKYSYAVSLVEYIRDGEIPYEVFDNLCKYNFKLFYDGYIACQLRVHFREEDNIRSHFVLLKPSIQTIDAECSMKCKADSSLNFEAERARLIQYYSPDLCLDPDPVAAEIIISNELNEFPFITPYLTHIIRNEKARREKGIQLMKKPKPQESAHAEPEEPTIRKKKENWDFRLADPTPEELKLSKSGSNLQYNDSITTYLKGRPICFPDSFTGFPVEIENFVYEYTGGKDDYAITDRFCVAVRDEREYYCGAYQLCEEEERKKEPSEWWNIGTREELDIHVNAFTFEEMKLTSGPMKITHNRIFEEELEHDGPKMRTTRHKPKEPVSYVVMDFKPPSFSDGDGDMEED